MKDSEDRRSTIKALLKRRHTHRITTVVPSAEGRRTAFTSLPPPPKQRELTDEQMSTLRMLVAWEREARWLPLSIREATRLLERFIEDTV